MARLLSLLSLGLVALALVAAAGCDGGQERPPQAATAGRPAEVKAPAATPKDGEHAHKPGGHGGNVVEIGRDNYHAEAVFEKGGAVRLYLLGKDEARVQEAESQTLTAYAKAEGATEAAPVTFRPGPQPGDSEGKTSLFLGKLPAELVGRKVEVTVPSIRINGERFRFAFASAAAHDEGMPEGLADAEERQLYLTPGGKYTEEDIKANGGVTAAQKFQGQMASHDLKPRPGDKVCPITLTKANPKFSWVVGGKTYQFCCPPCVDEFVKEAKEHPDQVKEPGEYVKK